MRHLSSLHCVEFINSIHNEHLHVEISDGSINNIIASRSWQEAWMLQLQKISMSIMINLLGICACYIKHNESVDIDEKLDSMRLELLKMHMVY